MASSGRCASRCSGVERVRSVAEHELTDKADSEPRGRLFKRNGESVSFAKISDGDADWWIDRWTAVRSGCERRVHRRRSQSRLPTRWCGGSCGLRAVARLQRVRRRCDRPLNAAPSRLGGPAYTRRRRARRRPGRRARSTSPARPMRRVGACTGADSPWRRPCGRWRRRHRPRLA